MFQRNYRTLFHLLLPESHSKESTSHLLNKPLLTLIHVQQTKPCRNTV